MIPPNLHASLKNKPIAVFGYGTSGRGVKALAERLDYECTCFDEKEIEGTRQEFSTGDAHHHSIVVVSPGFPDDHPWLALAKAARLEILTELDFGGLFLSHGVWGVTGTNGKTTTCQYLAHTLNLTGHGAVCVGNIGQSLCAWLAKNLDEEPHTRLIVEISSFQARYLKHLSLEGLIWTNFSENHLNHHRDIEEYFDAKWSLISRLSRPLFVVGESVFQAARTFGRQIPDFTLVIPNHPQGPADTLPEGSVFASAPFDEDFRLCAAFGERAGIPRFVWFQTAPSFHLSAHRLSKTTTIAGVNFYNDAKSTTFESTLAALRHFGSARPIRWIGGGESKGGDIEKFASALAPQIKAAYLIGQTGEKMTSLLRAKGVQATYCGKLERAVELAHSDADSGDIVLLSPGFSSFDQFTSFTQRGICFEKLVFGLQEAASKHTKV